MPNINPETPVKPRIYKRGRYWMMTVASGGLHVKFHSWGAAMMNLWVAKTM